MTPSLIFRPVLACAALAGLSACGMVEADPHRFENMAEAVAAIPLDGGPERTGAPAARTAAAAGLRPALRVQVMEPHALWDARDGGLRGLAEAQGRRLAAAAAPAVADAVARDVSARIDRAAARAGLRPARAPRASAPDAAGRLVQIGAYSSEAAAREAWGRLDLAGLTPVFEAVEVGGRRLVRLKVRAPAARAAAVCAAAGVDDPWCRRAA
ncbi:SPOR domain-containing protein [uncultured Brevundimonas sp.]|uniref:SPOR domain-containing protein n=1 Tax=uncultured Brevundimonas sp. TaxID=213418 RepID=UPI00262D654C|nr:SPOR domain-containing protein [uncultured Brevundimonas sp.]